MAKLQLVPECHAETTLVNVLFRNYDDDVFNHASGLHAVSKSLQKKDVDNVVSIGFIDKDKFNTPPYFDEFNLVAESPNVSLKKHPQTNDYLFVVKPAIEKFLLAQLTELNLDAAHFDMPNNFIQFKHQMKKSSIEKNENYIALLLYLKLNETLGIAFIKKHINLLRKL